VSWIWDVDFETVPQKANVYVSGDRVYDLALRIKYAGVSKQKTEKRNEIVMIEPNVESAVKKAISRTPKENALYILATYSAMLDVRQILKGRKIL